MNQDIMLRVFQLAENAEDHVDFAEVLEKAYRERYGAQMDDPAFVRRLLVEGQMSDVRRTFRKSVMDPDAIIEADQMSLFPVPGFVIVQPVDGEEITKPGRCATTDEVVQHFRRVERQMKAKHRKVAQATSKAIALQVAITTAGDDPVELLYVDAIEKHGSSALEALNAAIEA